VRESWHWRLAFVGLLASSACASGKPALVGREVDEISLPDEAGALIQMRRSGCPDAPCPVYSVSIFSDGIALYDGRANVGVMGRRVFKMKAADLSTLISTLEAMDFLDAADKCCVCASAPAPSIVTLDYRPGTVDKKVVHDQRCATAPVAFMGLEDQIDRLTGAARLAALPARSGVASGRSDRGGSDPRR
jgi:hypothetical protein